MVPAQKRVTGTAEWGRTKGGGNNETQQNKCSMHFPRTLLVIFVGFRIIF